MTTLNEDVTIHCDACKCGDSVDCMESLCRCSECGCEADGEAAEDMARYAFRAWKLVYGDKGE